jgi:hypothetical protein
MRHPKISNYPLCRVKFDSENSGLSIRYNIRIVGRDSSVGIATRHRQDGPVYRVLPVGKAVGAWRWPPTPSSAEAKERVELYIYSPLGPSWPVLGGSYPEHLLPYNTQVYYQR